MKKILGFLVFLIVVAMALTAFAQEPAPTPVVVPPSFHGLSYGLSDSVGVSDVQMLLRTHHTAAAGAGACSPYTWQAGVRGTKVLDALAFCGMVSGDIKGDDPQARISLGISPFNFGGFRTFIGVDPLHGGMVFGGGISTVWGFFDSVTKK